MLGYRHSAGLRGDAEAPIRTGEIHRRMPDKVLLICHWVQCRRVLSKFK